jgi:nucleoside-diphosphate-sugar epimerase
MRTALVTGSAGFVGRHFTRHLQQEGWVVDGVDILQGPEQDVRLFFRECGEKYDLVIHAAAVVGGRQNIDGAPLSLAANLEIDAAMFQWAVRTRPARVVYLSSSAVYPAKLQRPGATHRLDEFDLDLADPGMPDQLYGWAKLTGELLAARARLEGLGVTVVRPFSGYGEDQDDCYPFPAFIDRALRREDPFLIWGDGRQTRDFIHIDDIVGAVMEMVQTEHNGPLNLGHGNGVSMRQLAAMVCSAAGYAPEFEFAASAPAGVAYRVSSNIRQRGVYVSRVGLPEGIERALKYRKGLL